MTATSPGGALASATIPIRGDWDIVEARRRMRDMAAQLPFTPGAIALMATAVSELARNIINYAGEGEITVAVLVENRRTGMLVVARDSGPGIADPERAMQDGYSTSGGLGLGLPGTQRLMDEFELVTAPGAGTTVTAKKWVS